MLLLPEGMKLPFLNGEDWSLIIWAHSLDSSPKEFKKVQKLLTNYGATKFFESRRISRYKPQCPRRTEILRLAGGAANILRHKTFLQVIFPSENIMLRARDRLTRSRLPYRCDEYREKGKEVNTPSLPEQEKEQEKEKEKEREKGQDLRTYLESVPKGIYTADMFRRVAEFVDGVDKAGAVGLGCDEVEDADVDAASKRRNGTDGSAGGSLEDLPLVCPLQDFGTTVKLNVIVINDPNQTPQNPPDPNDICPYDSEYRKFVSANKQSLSRGASANLQKTKERSPHLTEDQVLEWYKRREVGHRKSFDTRSSQPPDARQAYYV